MYKFPRELGFQEQPDREMILLLHYAVNAEIRATDSQWD